MNYKFLYIIFFFSVFSSAQKLERSYIAKYQLVNHSFTGEIRISINEENNSGVILSLNGFNSFNYFRDENLLILSKSKTFVGLSDTLQIIENALLDEKNQKVYLKEKLYRSPKMLYVIDGEKYFEKVPKMSNGIIQKTPKKNRKLIHVLNKLDINLFEMHIITNYAAVQKYGADGTFGVVEFIKL